MHARLRYCSCIHACVRCQCTVASSAQASEEEAERKAAELESRLKVLNLSRAKSVQLLATAAAQLRARMDALKRIHIDLKRWVQSEVKGVWHESQTVAISQLLHD